MMQLKGRWIQLLVHMVWWTPNFMFGQEIQDIATQFSNDTFFYSSDVSVCIMDLETGVTIARVEADRARPPASVLKLVTAHYALSVLGPSFEYFTLVYGIGSMGKGGYFDGDIIIEPSGDPSLGSTQMKGIRNIKSLIDEIYLALKKKGIRTIGGQIKVVAPSNWNDPLCPTWSWQDLGNYYATGCWPLNIQENFYSVKFKLAPDQSKCPEIIEISPNMESMDMVNELVTGPAYSGDKAYIYGIPNGNQRIIRGSLPVGPGTYVIKGSFPNPSDIFITAIEKDLLERSIFCCYDSYSKEKSTRVPLCTWSSPTIEQLIKHGLEQSNNLYFESLIRTASIKEGGDGSCTSAADYMLDYLRKNGTDMHGCFFADGSGLSPFNRVSVHQICKIILRAYQNKGIWHSFLACQPSINQSSLSEYFTRNQNSTTAKSGSYRGVMNYAGTFRCKEKQYAYAFFMSGHPGETYEIKTRMSELLKDIQYLLCEKS